MRAVAADRAEIGSSELRRRSRSLPAMPLRASQSLSVASKGVASGSSEARPRGRTLTTRSSWSTSTSTAAPTITSRRRRPHRPTPPLPQASSASATQVRQASCAPSKHGAPPLPAIRAEYCKSPGTRQARIEWLKRPRGLARSRYSALLSHDRLGENDNGPPKRAAPKNKPLCLGSHGGISLGGPHPPSRPRVANVEEGGRLDARSARREVKRTVPFAPRANSSTA